MGNKIFDLISYFIISFLTTIANLAMINTILWVFANKIINFENWHCLLAYILTSIITYKIFFTTKE